MQKFRIQVPKTHYFKGYGDLKRFISYFYQIDLARKLQPKKVLEIGVGNKITATYLKQSGIEVDTCDFDKNLEPDYVADIRKLPFNDSSYDIIMAYEILEHIPWQDIDKALSELYRVSKKYVLISIPYRVISFEFVFKIPLMGKILKKPFINLFFGIPRFFTKIKFSGEHYWEMGVKNYPPRKIRRTLGKHFRILKEVRPILAPDYRFFILEKK